MKRFLINVSTSWCGEEESYSAIADNEEDLYDVADELAYENFSEFGGREKLSEELYPDLDITDDDAIEEADIQIDEVEHEHYFSNIEEWDESRPEEEWDSYELVYDKSKQ